MELKQLGIHQVVARMLQLQRALEILLCIEVSVPLRVFNGELHVPW